MDQPIGVPPFRFRVLFVVAVVLWASVLMVLIWYVLRFPGDFTQQTLAARALLEGANPYDSVGPNRPYPFSFPYYYPLPAAFFALPVAGFPLVIANFLFTLVTTGILAWGASRYRWRFLPIFASGAFVYSLAVAQWSMMLVACLLIPALAWIAAVKPNFAFAFAFARWERRYLLWLTVPALALGVIALVIMPDWPLQWLRVVRSAPDGLHSIPILFRGGFILLLALLRWRTFEGRLLLGCSVIPQTGLLYDVLPLWLIARTQAQGWVLTGFSLIALVAHHFHSGAYFANLTNLPTADFETHFRIVVDGFSPTLLALCYLPALAVLLWNGHSSRTSVK